MIVLTILCALFAIYLVVAIAMPVLIWLAAGLTAVWEELKDIFR